MFYVNQGAKALSRGKAARALETVKKSPKCLETGAYRELVVDSVR